MQQTYPTKSYRLFSGWLLLAAVLAAVFSWRGISVGGIRSGRFLVLLLFLLERAGPVLQQVEDLAASGPLEGDAVGLMLRAVGITVVGQVVARLCKDAGESALAYTVELAARAAVLAAALPALGRLLKYLGEIAAL